MIKLGVRIIYQALFLQDSPHFYLPSIGTNHLESFIISQEEKPF
jgi:hypothetical protein